jgi:hypothetical protein
MDWIEICLNERRKLQKAMTNKFTVSSSEVEISPANPSFSVLYKPVRVYFLPHIRGSNPIRYILVDSERFQPTA